MNTLVFAFLIAGFFIRCFGCIFLTDRNYSWDFLGFVLLVLSAELAHSIFLLDSFLSSLCFLGRVVIRISIIFQSLGLFVKWFLSV